MDRIDTSIIIVYFRIKHWLLLCISSSIRVILQCTLAFLFPGEFSIMLLTAIGFCIGVIFSTLIASSIKKLAGPHGSLLVSVGNLSFLAINYIFRLCMRALLEGFLFLQFYLKKKKWKSLSIQELNFRFKFIP